MTTSHIFSASLLGVSLVLVSASSAQAMMVRQTQEFSSSTNVKVEGGSNVNTSVESNSWGRQSQRVVVDDAATFSFRPMRGMHMGWSRGNRPVWVRPTANGEVRLTWDLRGGTCHVRYTEAGAPGFNYETSTSCDDGGITIGGLVSGKNYRFQVRQDDGAWSRTTTVRAW